MDSAINSDSQSDTQKVYSSMAQTDTELQQARNTLAIAMRDYAIDQTPGNKSKMDQAQNELHRLEREYREARLFVLQHITNKQTQQGKKS